MLRAIAFALPVSLLCAPAVFPLTQDDFFDASVVHEIRLRLNPGDWQRLRANYLSDTYYDCIFEWRGMTLQGVGIRSRGRGSRSGTKPSLRVDFNRFEEKQEFLGLKSIHLKNNAQDASMMHERLSMLMFRRMGLPAPREAHARLYVNDAYAGLYLIVEPVDKKFLKRHFGEDSGYLYQYLTPGDPYNFEYLGPDARRYTPDPFSPQTHEKDPQPQPLVDFIRVMNQASDADFAKAMAPYVNLKLYVTHAAIERFLAEADGILIMNNFFLYRFEGKNLNQFIVWDKDSAFLWPEMEALAGLERNVLMRRAFAVPEVRDAYAEALLKCAALAGGPGGWLQQEIAFEYAQIRESVYRDTFKQCGDGPRSCSNEEFESAAADLMKFARERSAFIMKELAESGLPGGLLSRLWPGAVRNAAGGSPLLAPGGLASVWGEGLATESTGAGVVPLPDELGGAGLYVNGFPAPLLFVSPGQINFQIPWNVRPGRMLLTAFRQSRYAGSVAVDVDTYSPGIFAVTHADGSLVDTAKPAQAGETLIIYATGLGPVNRPQASGRSAPGQPLAELIERPRVTIGGIESQVLFGGLAPGFVGVYQVNVAAPGIHDPRPDTPLMLAVGGENSAVTLIPTR